MTNRRVIFSAALSMFMLASHASVAQNTALSFGASTRNADAPVEVTADALSINQDDGTAVFSGNVLVGQGDMRLSAEKVQVMYNQAQTGIDTLLASGGVTLVSGPDAAEARAADYDVSTGVVVMTGNVLLTQGVSALASDRVTINLNDGTASMTGRVKTVLQPKSARE